MKRIKSEHVKRLGHTQKKNAGNLFAGANERGLLATVGNFGEEIAAALIGGTIVSQEADYTFADVVHHGLGIAIEVKMANQRHAHRTMPQQIDRLNEGVANTSFLFNHGVYFLICYRGVHRQKKNDGKSLIWSRRNSTKMRKKIIARELQCVYVVDVGFLQYLVQHEPGLLRNGTIVSSVGKSGRETVLYLNRTTLSSFIKRTEESRLLLERALGRHNWCVKTKTVNVSFTGKNEGESNGGNENLPPNEQPNLPLTKTLPVHFIGTRKTGYVIGELLDGRQNVEVPIVSN